ncbi:serpin-ZX-like [Olea europaea subsp. europaea]|uniref:Serpin-ZX-like n=1 Tax=Olea europaea subsp. europaea TaxID=158383 RepID=A0A8S0PYP3_OLEEU|nr:serpin-ZX-like [Olea europaea subsp. europaea]
MLGLIAAGSKGNMLDQLLSFLKSTGTEELNSLSSQLVTLVFADGGSLGGPRLSFANGVWIDRSLCLKPKFKEIVDNAYKAAARNVDCQTKAVEVTKEVNLWAEKETSGLIKEFFHLAQLMVLRGSLLQMRFILKDHGMRSLMLRKQ